MLIVGIGNIQPHATLMEAMRAGGFTMNQMANAIDVHRTTMARYCHGEIETPRCVALAALAFVMASGVQVLFENPFSELAVATKRGYKGNK